MKLKLIAVLIVLSGSMRADILNGNFETGTFANWTVGGTDGNAQVYTSADVSPFTPGIGAGFFAFLSNGPGVVTDPGNPATTLDTTTLTSIPYDVAVGAKISFSLQFLSNEPFAGGNPDFFQVNVIGLTSLLLQAGSVSASQQPIPGGPVFTPDGTFVSFFEPAFTVTDFDLSAFAGQTVRFQFLVSDAIENSFDSALLVDDVHGTGLTAAGPAAVPEPGSIVLLASAMLLFLVKKLRRPQIPGINWQLVEPGKNGRHWESCPSRNDSETAEKRAKQE